MKRVGGVSMSMLFVFANCFVSTANPVFAQEVSTSEVSDSEMETIDFSSKRILVKHPDSIIDKTSILSNIDDVYLLQFENEESTRESYEYYKNHADSVSVDMKLSIANEDTKTENVVIEEFSEEENPFTLAKEVEKIPSSTIALIDTGVTKNKAITDSLTVLENDDGKDRNGHGDDMVAQILSQNPKAKILSIKAIDDTGHGSISSVYAGIELAIQAKVNIINLSFTAYSTLENEILEEIIHKATSHGIKVVVAAGNNGNNVELYTPSNIMEAIVVGSCNEEGARNVSSNYGDLVDYNVVANTTSRAAAKMSGYLSNHDKIEANKNGLIFSTDYTSPIENVEPVDETGEQLELTPSDGEKEVEDLKEVNNVTVMVKYLYVDSTQVSSTDTITDVMMNKRNAVYTQLQEYVKVYQDEDGNYKVLADTPFVNGIAIADPISYDFANGNDFGEGVTEGVSFDTKTKVATIQKDVLKKAENAEFADLQLQLMVPADITSDVDIQYSAKDLKKTVKLINHNGSIQVRPFMATRFQAVSKATAKNISQEDIELYINGSEEPLSVDNYAYDQSSGEIAIDAQGATIKSIRLVVNKNGEFSVANAGIAEGTQKVGNYGVIAYLADGTNSNAFTVGASINIRGKFGNNNWPAAPADGPTELYNASYNNVSAPNADGQMAAAGTSQFGVPTNAFGVDFTFRRQDGTPYPLWEAGYNSPIRSWCHHVRGLTLNSSANIQEFKYPWCTLRVLDKQVVGGYTHVVFGFETNLWQYDRQCNGAVFEVAFKDKGKAKLKKESANPEITDGNSGYSLANAVYTIYSNEGCTQAVGSFTTNENGDSAEVELSPGTYYVKETTAPTGYVLDETVYPLQVTTDKVATLTVQDLVQYEEPDEIINKVDKETNGAAQGDATLAGAEFTVKYYDGQYTADPATQGARPKRTWTLRTDEEGTVSLDDAHKVSGDDFYLSSGGVPVLPVGTITIQETKAPTGYLLDNTVHVRQIKTKDQGTQEDINNYVAVTSQDQIITGQFKVIKTIATGDSTQIAQPEQGGQFTVVAKKYVEQYGSVEEAIKHKAEFTDMEWDILTTNAEGEAVSKQLAYGDYVIKQTKAPEEINKLEEPFNFTVNQPNQTIKRYMINNIPSKYYIRMVKKDAETGENVSLGATSFKIKNTKTNEYVTQKVGQFTYDTFTTASSREDGIPEGSFVAVQDVPGTVSTPLTLPSGTYQLEEVQVPSGYLAPENPIPFEVKEANVAEVGEDSVPIIEVVMENNKPTGKIVLNKTFETHPAKANPVATFQLTAGSTIFNPATGEVLYNKGDIVTLNGVTDGLYTTDENGKIEISGLPLSDGTATYVLKEVSTTDGYVLDKNEYTFTFGITDTVTQEYTVTEDVENILTTLEVSKQDISGEEVPGAQLQILDDQGKVVEEWTSTDTPHIVKGLTVGKTYTLHEKVAADGYVIANDIQFTVDNITETQTIKMVDEQTFVNKFDNKQTPLSNAKLQVVDKNGDVVDSWTSGNTTHAISGLKVGETYTLMEVEAPEGYVLASPITFTVTDDEQNQTINMYDKQVLFDKRDDEQNFVEGATMEVTTEDGALVDTWTTSNDYHAISGLTAGDTYTLTETETPEGYVTAEPQTFTVADDKNNEIITMIDKQVFFTKLDTQSQMVEGAKMQVLDSQEQVVDSWQTGTETVALNGLKDGETYTLREVEAPKGYVRAEDIEFSVPKGQDEQAVVDQNLAMTDVVESVKKVDQFGRQVNGAKLQVTSPDGSIVYDEWTTGQSLVTLTEEQKAELTQNGSITWEGALNTEPYQMSTSDEEESEAAQEDKDENVVVRLMNRVSRALGINSTDEEQTEETEQPGEEEETEQPQKTYQFTMKVIDSNSVVTQSEEDANKDVVENGLEYELKAIDEEGTYYYFTIDENGYETSHRISNLDANTDYVLKEVEAPANHAVSPDINFTTLDNQDQTVEMLDTKLDDVVISKVDVATSEELPGAELEVTDKDGNVVDSWTSTEEPHLIEGLVVGEEYTLTEVVAPEFYEVAESITFTVEDNDEEMQKITMKDEHKKEDVEITKKDMTTKGELPGAHLQVTDKDGNVVDEWISTNEPHIIKNLLVGETYTLTETIAPQYYELAESVEFTVQEGGVNRIEMFDEHKVDTVEISKQDITTKKELPGAELEVKDKNGKTVDKWTSGKEPHPIEGLLVGEEYTLIETRAPKGYKVAEQIKFTVEDNGKATQRIVMYDEEQEVKTGVDEDKPNIILPTVVGLGGLGLALIAIRKARRYSE